MGATCGRERSYILVVVEQKKEGMGRDVLVMTKRMWKEIAPTSLDHCCCGAGSWNLQCQGSEEVTELGTGHSYALTSRTLALDPLACRQVWQGGERAQPQATGIRSEQFFYTVSQLFPNCFHRLITATAVSAEPEPFRCSRSCQLEVSVFYRRKKIRNLDRASIFAEQAPMESSCVIRYHQREHELPSSGCNCWLWIYWAFESSSRICHYC